MKTFLIFVVQGFEQETPTGDLINSCHIELIDTSPENAIKRASKIIKKKHYRVSMVLEKVEDKNA